MATTKYRFTVRYTAEEVEILRKAARDAPLTTYIGRAALRDAKQTIAPSEPRPGVLTPPRNGGLGDS